MATIFEPTAIQGLTLPNRLVRSATWEGMCTPEGRPTPELTRYLQTLARGGTGLIIAGCAFVQAEGRMLPGQMGIHCNDFADDFRALTQGVHTAGGLLACQLVHAGGQTTAAASGRQPMAPSALKVAQYAESPTEMDLAAITACVAAFGEGARRAKAWGFDAVQLHAAHGYLINQFLSPLTNRRTDDYGGTLANRARFARQVYQAVRAAVGADFPVLIKLNGSDNLPGGFNLEEAVQVALWLCQEGLDVIEVSSGTPGSGKQTPARERIKSPQREAYNLDLALRVKAAVACPVMTVGGFRSYEVVEKAVSAGLDYVSLSRPLIREPDLPRRWQAGDRSPAACISCNGCFQPGLKEGGIYCVQAAKARGIHSGV
jgi:2,4-dienoyl-CoA reductase-like NADH-dependent reductase (Old Yellow Enzyme family)